MIHLVIGASGQIGESLIKEILKDKQQAVGTFFSTSIYGKDNSNQILSKIPGGKIFSLDISDFKKTNDLIDDIRPDVVYICVPNNIPFGLNNIISAIKDLKKQPTVVLFSSSNIFSKFYKDIYSESDIANIYGNDHPALLSLTCEHNVMCNIKKYIIIRTSDIFGISSNKKNILYAKDVLEEGNAIYSSSKLFIQPTYLNDLTKVSYRLAKSKNIEANIIHIAGSEYISEFDFYNKIAKALNLNSSLIKDTEYNKKTPRLSTELLEKRIGKELSYINDALKKIKETL